MNNTISITKKALITFFVMIVALSAAVETMIITGGPEWLYLVLMWIPALSAVVASIVCFSGKKEELTWKGMFASLGIRRCKITYILLGILIPLVYLLIPYMVYWRIHPENYGYSGVSLHLVLKDILPILIIGVFTNIISALGEEIGWRGFMLPALSERMGKQKTLFLTGLIWAAWHLPLLVFGDYMSGAPLWYKLPAFVLCILPVGIIVGCLTFKSGSIWPAAFLHAAHNNFDQAVFGVITRGADKMYYVSETGLITIVCAWLIAVILLASLRKTGEA